MDAGARLLVISFVHVGLMMANAIAPCVAQTKEHGHIAAGLGDPVALDLGGDRLFSRMG